FALDERSEKIHRQNPIQTARLEQLEDRIQQLNPEIVTVPPCAMKLEGSRSRSTCPIFAGKLRHGQERLPRLSRPLFERIERDRPRRPQRLSRRCSPRRQPTTNGFRLSLKCPKPESRCSLARGLPGKADRNAPISYRIGHGTYGCNRLRTEDREVVQLLILPD